MRAAVVDLVIEQGTNFSETFEWLDNTGTVKDLSNYTVSIQIRTKNGELIASSTGMANISIDTTNLATGLIVVSMTAAQTKVLDFVQGSYDIEFTAPTTGVVTRLVEGLVNLSKEQTRID